MRRLFFVAFLVLLFWTSFGSARLAQRVQARSVQQTTIARGAAVARGTKVMPKDYRKYTSDFGDSLDVMYEELGSSGTYIIYVDQDCTLFATKTFGTNVYFEFQPGAKIVVSTGQTLTICSPEHVLCPARQTAFATSGTGIVSFVNGGTVYPGWWGAVGDGIADDTSTIQAAVDAVGPLGGVVQLPQGQYKVTTAIALRYNNVSMVGNGATLVNGSTAGANTVQIGYQPDNCSGVKLQHIGFDVLPGARAGTHVALRGAVSVTIDGVNMKGGMMGIRLGGECYMNHVTRFCIASCRDYGIAICPDIKNASNSENWFSEGRCDGCNISNAASAIYVARSGLGACDRNTFRNVDIEGTNGIGLEINNARLTVWDGGYFDEQSAAVTAHVKLCGGSSQVVLRNLFWGGISKPAGNCSIWIVDAADVLIENCYSSGTQTFLRVEDDPDISRVFLGRGVRAPFSEKYIDDRKSPSVVRGWRNDRAQELWLENGVVLPNNGALQFRNSKNSDNFYGIWGTVNDAVVVGGLGNTDISLRPGAHSCTQVYRNDAETSAPGLVIEQHGTGDAILDLLLTDARRWRIAVDNSDSDSLKIASSYDLASAVIAVTTSGRVGIGDSDPNCAFGVAGDVQAEGINVGDAGGFSGLKFNRSTRQLEVWVDGIKVGNFGADGTYSR